MGITFKTETKVRVRVNGKEYTSLEDVPPELRAVLDKALAQRAGDSVINIEGKSYASVDDLPPEVRLKYETYLRMAGEGLDMPAPGKKFTFRFGVARDEADEFSAPYAPQSSVTAFLVGLAIVAAALLMYLVL
jgi:hypothetical protein